MDRLVRHGVAIFLVSGAALGHWLAWGWLSSARFVLFYPAVTLAAWFGGWVPGLAATVVGGILAQLVMSAHWPGQALVPTQLLQFGIFLVHGVILSVLIGRITSRQRQMQDRSEAVRVLEQERARLQEAIRARDEFLSIASHELKTPLTSLSLQAQIRKKSLQKSNTSPLSPEKLALMFDNDVRQLNRLALLVDDMLDVSRITSGTFSVLRAEVELCSLLDEVISRHKAQLDHAGCMIRRKCVSSIVGRWDRQRLEQVFTNLISNALKYGAGKPVEISIDGKDRQVFVTVRDNGIGIPLEHQQRIFERFERAVSANSISGLGLGLYIARKIVEAHDGSIRVESEPGKGAAFTVALPLEERYHALPRPERCKKCHALSAGAACGAEPTTALNS